MIVQKLDYSKHVVGDTFPQIFHQLNPKSKKHLTRLKNITIKQNTWKLNKVNFLKMY